MRLSVYAVDGGMLGAKLSCNCAKLSTHNSRRADTGADLDFLVGASGSFSDRESH